MLIISLLLLLFVVLGVSWYFTSGLLQPGSKDCSAEHYVFCNKPSELDLPFEDVAFQTKDGVTIRGWYINGKSKNAGILLVHGSNGSRHAGLRYAPSLYEKGFNLLLIDLRNCGESEDFYDSMGFHERNDIHAGIKFLTEIKNLSSIGVFGFSMGGAAAIMAMSENPLIKAGVFESSFSDVESVIADELKNRFRMFPNPMISLVKSLYEKRIDGDISNLTPLIAIPRIFPRPIFIIHGTGDNKFPIIHGVKLYIAAKYPKKIWPVKNGKHARSWQADRVRAEKEVPQYFQEHLKL